VLHVENWYDNRTVIMMSEDMLFGIMVVIPIFYNMIQFAK